MQLLPQPKIALIDGDDDDNNNDDEDDENDVDDDNDDESPRVNMILSAIDSSFYQAFKMITSW